ncbi:hypothetical protein V5O48_009793 [Marasmius crinis-equi]|uniref:Uncharacterized protein n=1 Tax=Marasmius crinis-equi TaxID=585013 RepID=A0ABR3FA77_9AGAR
MALMTISALQTYCVVRLGGEYVFFDSFRNLEFCTKTQTASYVIPAATTLISTILIGVKAWTYSSGGLIRMGVSRKTGVERTMILLLESGIACFIFFTTQTILSLQSVSSLIGQHRNLSFATTVFTFQTSALVGIYPTIIIWLVHTNRSYSETISQSINGTTAHIARRSSAAFGRPSVSTSLTRSGGASSQVDSLSGGRDLEIDIRKEVVVEMDGMSLGTDTPSMGGRPSLGDAKPNLTFQ